jgi:hypothetical protein
MNPLVTRLAVAERWLYWHVLLKVLQIYRFREIIMRLIVQVCLYIYARRGLAS